MERKYGDERMKRDRIKRKYVKWMLGLQRQKNTELYTNRRNKNDRNKNRSNWKSNHHEEKARNSRKKLVVECRKDLEKVKTKKEERKWEVARGDLRNRNRNRNR